MDNIYISTGAFRTKNLNELLKIADANGINNIELSSGLEFNEDVLELVMKYKRRGFKFLIHNYFPTPKIPFVLNLASINKDIISKSIKLCMYAIDMASMLESEFYSVHAGFAFDGNPSDLGSSSQMELSRNNLDICKSIFIENMRKISQYGEEKGVKIAIENNAFASFALTDNKNEMYLCVSYEDFDNILKGISSDNVYVLLDLAHLKLASNVLNISSAEFIKNLQNKIIAAHISDNDGLIDTNDMIIPDTEVTKQVKYFKDKYLVLEVYNLSCDQIRSQIEIIKSCGMDV